MAKKENKESIPKTPRKTKAKESKVNQKKENPPTEDKGNNPGTIDDSMKRKLIAKLKQQPGWEDRGVKECQRALEQVDWDYNAIFGKSKKKRKKDEEDEEVQNVQSVLLEEPDEVLQVKEEEKGYVQGLDSKWVLSYKTNWRPAEFSVLDQVNKKLGTSYTTWKELSEKHNPMTEEFLTQYEGYISWYHLWKTHNPENYSAKFKKKMKDHFLIAELDLVPRTYTKAKDFITKTSEES